ncbi:MAG: hypothetical protein GY708_30675 [Actinomycetia bacterium]|nr:hypothetical protein [Actinomycetes bacterium]MCP4958656.1 hypothetical protein [Actinomycetes bacterium]
MSDEPSDDEDCCGELERCVSVVVLAAGSASELDVVGLPRIEGFDDPAQAEGEAVRFTGFGSGASLPDVEFGQTAA